MSAAKKSQEYKYCERDAKADVWRNKDRIKIIEENLWLALIIECQGLLFEMVCARTKKITKYWSIELVQEQRVGEDIKPQKEQDKRC